MRRARAALTAALALAAAALPSAALLGLLPGSPASAASTDNTARAASVQQGGSPVSLAITGMTPQWATPTATIRVQGIITNESKQPISDLAVQLYTSSQPVGSVTQLQSSLSGQAPLADTALTSPPQILASPLQPGSAVSWSISFPARAAGMTAFGVYPLTAQVGAEVGGTFSTTLGYANTFLPYLPAGHGSFAKTRPAAEQVAWVWPLIDTPLAALPGQRDCAGSQVSQLDASLAPGGRLDGLLAAGSSYARADSLTWAIDPALLTDASALSACADVAPGVARTSAAWLARLRTVTAGQPLFVTPYADVSLALIQGHSADVGRAFTLGRQAAHAILQRDVTPSGSGPQVAGIAWPPAGSAGYSTVENLATDGVQTVLLDSAKVTSGTGSAFLVADGEAGGYMRVLLYSDALAKILGAATSAPGSGFEAAQAFLAGTALMAAQDPGQPIVVAPPQRWQPPAGLADAVLKATASAPWLKPVALTSLESHLTGSDTLQLPDGVDAGSLNNKVLRQLDLVDQGVAQVASIRASYSPDLYEAVAALESSAWDRSSRAFQLNRLATLEDALYKQERDVLIVTDNRVTLGGLKGNVPVLIDNKLSYPVTVRLQLSWHQPPGGGIRVEQQPQGVITVAGRSQQAVRIRVEATQVGATTITMRLLNRRYGPLPRPPVSVTVQATQFGTLAMIIMAGALGLFMIASAVRAIRRGGPAPPDHTGDTGDFDDERGSQEGPEPDTVIPERSELGTAGKSGLS
ncbi:MAG TPA: DUF6049 family protein [Streptosporangiaceae bacterium]|nr:DUF6049 family protein [Streptosporangiaceae bacterium]